MECSYSRVVCPQEESRPCWWYGVDHPRLKAKGRDHGVPYCPVEGFMAAWRYFCSDPRFVRNGPDKV